MYSRCIAVLWKVKAYTTRVGHGPFPTELQNEMQSLEALEVRSSAMLPLALQLASLCSDRTTLKPTLAQMPGTSARATQAG